MHISYLIELGILTELGIVQILRHFRSIIFIRAMKSFSTLE